MALPVRMAHRLVESGRWRQSQLRWRKSKGDQKHRESAMLRPCCMMKKREREVQNAHRMAASVPMDAEAVVEAEGPEGQRIRKAGTSRAVAEE